MLNDEGTPKQQYRVEAETHHPVMDIIDTMSGNREDAEWVLSWLEKILDDSAFNLGLKIVEMKA